MDIFDAHPWLRQGYVAVLLVGLTAFLVSMWGPRLLRSTEVFRWAGIVGIWGGIAWLWPLRYPEPFPDWVTRLDWLYLGALAVTGVQAYFFKPPWLEPPGGEQATNEPVP